MPGRKGVAVIVAQRHVHEGIDDSVERPRKESGYALRPASTAKTNRAVAARGTASVAQDTEEIQHP